jgi:hypothetical protein
MYASLFFPYKAFGFLPWKHFPEVAFASLHARRKEIIYELWYIDISIYTRHQQQINILNA